MGPFLVKGKAILVEALGFQEVQDPKISRQLAQAGGKVFSPTHRPSLPQAIFLIFISFR